jgi:hypothetical protein
MPVIPERPQTTLTLVNERRNKISIRPASNIVLKKPASTSKFAANKSVDEKLSIMRSESPNGAVTTTLKQASTALDDISIG